MPIIVKRFQKKDPLQQPKLVNRWEGAQLRTGYKPRGVFNFTSLEDSLEAPSIRKRAVFECNSSYPLPPPEFCRKSAGVSFSHLDQPCCTSPTVVLTSFAECDLQEPAFQVDTEVLSGLCPAPTSGVSMLASTQAQLQRLHQQWLPLVEHAGCLSSLFRSTQGTLNAGEHRVRAIAKYSPATLSGYFRAWSRWESFAKFHNSSVFRPVPVMVGDFLLSSSKKVHSGSALQLVKALNFLTRHLGLEEFTATLHQSWLKAYQAPTNPVIRREASPHSPALRIVIGAILVAIWSSLRWSDMQWVSMDSLIFEQNVLRMMAHRTKTTKRGMAIGLEVRGFLGVSLDESGTSSIDCRSVRFDRPLFHGPMHRSQGLKILRFGLSRLKWDAPWLLRRSFTWGCTV